MEHDVLLQLSSVKLKQNKQLNKHPLLHIIMIFSLNRYFKQDTPISRYCHVISRNIYQSTNTL
jgi:hypothetical protein